VVVAHECQPLLEKDNNKNLATLVTTVHSGRTVGAIGIDAFTSARLLRHSWRTAVRWHRQRYDTRVVRDCVLHQIKACSEQRIEKNFEEGTAQRCRG